LPGLTRQSMVRFRMCGLAADLCRLIFSMATWVKPAYDEAENNIRRPHHAQSQK